MDPDAVVDAEDIVADLYEDEVDDVEESHEDVVDDLNYDVYNLVTRNYHPVQAGGDDFEGRLLENTTRSAQLLIKKIFECPVERTEVGPVAVLPTETSRLPREKPIPEPKPLTNWEKFAAQKGIKKKKKERMVYDDNEDRWAPRFGYKSAKNTEMETPVMVVKTGQDPYADPWERAREEKKLRIDKNKLAQQKNIERTNGKLSHKRGGRPEPNLAGIPVDMGSGSGKGKLRGKENLQTALQLAQYSTQSLGRFDEARKGEPEKKLKGKKRAFRDNMDGTSKNEKDIMKSQIRIVTDAINKKQKRVSNNIDQYEGILPDAPSNSFKQKKGLMKHRSSKKGK